MGDFFAEIPENPEELDRYAYPGAQKNYNGETAPQVNYYIPEFNAGEKKKANAGMICRLMNAKERKIANKFAQLKKKQYLCAVICARRAREAGAQRGRGYDKMAEEMPLAWKLKDER